VKKPFLAPFGTPFVGNDATDYVRSLLAPESLAESGFFDPQKVAQLVAHVERQKLAEPSESTPHMTLNRGVIQKTLAGMALTFVVSTQVLFDQIQSGKFEPRRDAAPVFVPHRAPVTVAHDAAAPTRI
jgi:hypothetical protein